MSAASNSMMPENLEKEVTPKDVADLIAYLERKDTDGSQVLYREGEPAAYRQRQAERLLNYDRVDEAVQLYDGLAQAHPQSLQIEERAPLRGRIVRTP